MTDRLDPDLAAVVRAAAAEVLDDADRHVDAYLAQSPSRRSLDHAEAGGLGVDLMPEIVRIVTEGWSMAQRLASEHPHLVNVGEGALGNALYAAIKKAFGGDAAGGPPRAGRGLTTDDVDAVAKKVADLIADLLARRRAAGTPPERPRP